MRRIDGALERMIEYYYGQANFKVMLLSGGESLLPSATLRDFLGKEVITPGYSRQPIGPSIRQVQRQSDAMASASARAQHQPSRAILVHLTLIRHE